MKFDKHELDFKIDRTYIHLISTFGLTDATKIVNGVKKKLMNEKKRRKELK